MDQPIPSTEDGQTIVKDGMVVAPHYNKAIAILANSYRTPDQPDAAVHHLGTINVPDGRAVPVHMRHAVDAVVMDRHGNVLLIERAHNPGAGKLALPGGFIDPDKQGTAEMVAAAVLRELAEETGFIFSAQPRVVALGPRRSFRPFDVREAWKDMPDVGIKKGDFFIVTTIALGFEIFDLTALQLRAGDDARKIVIRNVGDLTQSELGIEDHAEFIATAAHMLELPVSMRAQRKTQPALPSHTKN